MNQELLHRIQVLRQPLIAIADKYNTPLYVYDPKEVRRSYGEFDSAFRDVGESVEIFYAIKSNPCSLLLKTVVEQGAGLDASSHRELKLALEAGAKRIIYTGPAKKERDFELILDHADCITVNLETVRELTLLAEMAKKRKTKIRCGLRIITNNQSGWTKFGLPLNQLREFYDKASAFPEIEFCGIHFHISFNTNPDNYVRTLEEVAKYLTEQFSNDERQQFTYLDIGGGIYPVNTWEGYYPWNKDLEHAACPTGTLDMILNDEYHPRYIPMQITPVKDFASAIVLAMQNHIRPALPNAKMYLEPGRYLSQNSLHILLSITDIKEQSICITDGGNNMIGWEKYQHFWYTPVFNLTHFSVEREIPSLLYGSLCTPDDIWGYYLYCSDVQEGDLICLPYQGAYTYTFAQEFIREIPDVVYIGLNN
ncbi:alanine racemase [Patescibacteria group bacterium]|nr:alanine racemase [Patescibacteria group bacterium]MBU1123752.1 alanine racemase [Patescibacteria group bacterium]MBU1910825.1 alanine racemase [Patescibacteria group bacterium]